MIANRKCLGCIRGEGGWVDGLRITLRMIADDAYASYHKRNNDCCDRVKNWMEEG